ncbi:MAG: serine hydrolase domain-containing protein, partial [Methanobacterium sp.]
MNTKVLIGIILVFVIVAAIAGSMIYNSLNFNQPVNNAVINTVNQSIENNTTLSDNVHNSGSILTLIQYSSGNYKPNPTPSTDPLDHIISLFDAYVKSIFPKTGAPGAAIAIVKDGKIVYMNCLGLRDVASGERVDENTLFFINSNTKAFASTNIAQLVDAGLMSWDDPITKYYPDLDEFQLYDSYVTNNITIRDCLCHRSGLAVSSGDDNIDVFNYTFPFTLHQMRYIENNTPFKSTYQYSDIIYALAGYCAARVTNTTWSDLIKQDLLDPLGMINSTTTIDDFMNSPNHATSYSIISDHTITNDDCIFNSLGPAGIIGCSISDLVKWLNFQIVDTGIYNGVQIVSKKELDETRTGQIDSSSIEKYGFGWIINDLAIHHGGHSDGFQSNIAIYPSKGLGMAVLVNQGPYGIAFTEAMYNKFTDLLRGIDTTDTYPAYVQYVENLYFKPVLDPPIPPIIDPLPLNTYTGIYYNYFYGNVNITSGNNSLTCYYGNNTKPYDLKHWNGNIFTDPNHNQYLNFT